MSTRTDGQLKEKRILVLGSARHTRLVTAYEWDKLPSELNVADYDVIIMDFTPFANKAFAAGINLDTLPGWEQFARHLFSSGSENIVIGSPNFKLGANPYRDSMWWLPIKLTFVCESGETVELKEPDFAFYFELVNKWTFYFDVIEETSKEFFAQYLRVGAPGWQLSEPVALPIAQSRFERPIALALAFRGGPADPRARPLVGVQVSGEVFWLPAPTLASSHDAIDLILKRRYGLRFEQEEPDWVSGFVLPSESPILMRIGEIEAGLGELNQELGKARADLADKSRFRKLLYERGEDVLEPIVRDALRALGATVEEPKVKKREDGRLIDPRGRNGMLEIKGRTGSLALKDVRELDNWVRDAIANENWQSKGFLIVNLQCEMEPKSRKDFFPPNCISAAKIFGICLLTTTQLFRAIVEDQRKTLDRIKFWDELCGTDGPCSITNL